MSTILFECHTLEGHEDSFNSKYGCDANKVILSSKRLRLLARGKDSLSELISESFLNVPKGDLRVIVPDMHKVSYSDLVNVRNILLTKFNSVLVEVFILPPRAQLYIEYMARLKKGLSSEPKTMVKSLSTSKLVRTIDGAFGEENVVVKYEKKESVDSFLSNLPTRKAISVVMYLNAYGPKLQRSDFVERNTRLLKVLDGFGNSRFRITVEQENSVLLRLREDVQSLNQRVDGGLVEVDQGSKPFSDLKSMLDYATNLSKNLRAFLLTDYKSKSTKSLDEYFGLIMAARNFEIQSKVNEEGKRAIVQKTHLEEAVLECKPVSVLCELAKRSMNLGDRESAFALLNMARSITKNTKGIDVLESKLSSF